ncbi:MAG: hypothetical protein NT007_08780 [Candidatus Kapabacteria bacterium]|nr:hypothetical protein [Candidatus Kapabacteria bacterium]
MELTENLKELVWQRQKGMCGSCGKKIEVQSENIQNAYLPFLTGNDPNEIPTQEMLMLCNMCHGEHTSKKLITEVRKYSFPFANFSNYKYNDLYNDVKNDVFSSIEQINSLTDLRESKSKMKELHQIFRSVNLEREHHDELHNAISKVNDEIRQQIQQSQEKTDLEFLENYNKLKNQITEATQASETATDLKGAREALIKAQTLFSEYKIKNENRIELNSILQSAFEKLNSRQAEEWEKYEMECSDNYYSLKSIVEEAANFADKATEFKSAREKLIEVQNEIRGKKLKKEQRDSLYERIRGSFDNLNTRQSEERIVYEKECEENFASISKIMLEGIEFSSTSIIFKEARERLIDLQNQIKNLKLKKEQRDNLFDQIRSAFDSLNERQSSEREVYDSECETNYNSSKIKIDDIKAQIDNFGNFGQIRDNLITIQSELKILKLKKNQRTDLFNSIRNAFGSLDAKRQEYKKIKNDDKLKKLNSILINLDNKILRIEESITRDQQTLSGFVTINDIDEIETEFSSANDSDKIISIKARISDKEASLNDAKARIQDIQFELAELNKEL